MYLYSSPPFRIKSIPVLDSLFNCLFGFGPFAIGYSLFGGIGFLNTAFIFFSFTFSAAHAIFAVVDLDEDKKATMVSNLMVVLCGDKEATPVVNTGTLYQ